MRISGPQQRWSRPLPGAFLIPPALLVVADSTEQDPIAFLIGTCMKGVLEGNLIKFLFKSPIFLPAAPSMTTVATFTNLCAIKTRRHKKRNLEEQTQKILCVPDEKAVLRNAEIFAADLAIAVNAELCYVHVNPPRPGDSGDETKKIAFLISATIIKPIN